MNALIQALKDAPYEVVYDMHRLLIDAQHTYLTSTTVGDRMRYRELLNLEGELISEVIRPRKLYNGYVMRRAVLTDLYPDAMFPLDHFPDLPTKLDLDSDVDEWRMRRDYE